MSSTRLLVASLVVVASLGCGSSDGVLDDGLDPGVGGGSSAAVGGSSSVGTTSSGQGGSSSGSSSGGAGAGDACPPPPACDATPPDPGPAQSWLDPLTPIIVTSQGGPQHRGRDLFLNTGDPQWVLAKFTYGPFDKDLKGELVDIYLSRDCSGNWEKLGSATTTLDDQHAAVEGVDDTGGRIYFQIPSGKELGLGRHRLHLVVKGDLSSTDVFIEVVDPATPVFVSDVDGTLTTAETEEFTDLLLGQLPDANPSAAEALSTLAAKGARPFYLTARPEWLTQRTRDFLALHGFPPGIVHTTLSTVGALGGQAVSYKTGELDWLASKGLSPLYAFGNTSSDGEAYDNAAVQPLTQRIFFQFDDSFGGRRIDSYADLLGEFGALPTCL